MGNRWRAHRVTAWIIRIAIFLTPILVGLAVSFWLATAIPDGGTVASVLFWWVAVLGGAVSSAVLAERLLRRLVPVTTLLRLSLAFPDKAPSRFSVMLRSFTTRGIGRRLASGELDHLPGERMASERLLSLLASLAAHDPQTRGHAERVRAYADLIGEELGLEEPERERLRWGALLHDIGKVAVPTSLLNKPGALDEVEWDVVRTHPLKGDELISGMHDWLGDWRLTVAQHHERWDGTGYPLGLVGRGISLGGRIVSVCDAFDAMTSVRAYGDRVNAEAARTEIARVSGDQFDPRVVRALMRVSIGRLRAPLGVWAWIPAFSVPGALERLGKHASVVAAAVFVLVGASALAADMTPSSPQPAGIEVAGISIEPSSVSPAPSISESKSLAGASSGTVTSDPSPTGPPGEPADSDVAIGPVSDDTTATEQSNPNTVATTATTAPVSSTSTATVVSSPTTTTTISPTSTATTAPSPTVPPPPTTPPTAPALAIAVDEDGFASFVLSATGATDLVEPPARGVAEIDAEGQGWYRPNPDENGRDRFTYRACVGAACAEGVVEVGITAINDAPVAVDDAVAVASDGAVTILVLGNDTDVDGDPLFVSSVESPSTGSVSTDGTTVDFQPLGHGADVSFEYLVCDPHGACSTGLIQVDVFEPQPAGAVDDSFMVSGPQPSRLDVLANDELGPGPLTLSINVEPAVGTVSILGNDGVLFKPPKLAGTTSFVYGVCDADGRCSQATVTVTFD